MLAKHPLYQLSYGPNLVARSGELVVRSGRQEMVGPGRLELPTLRLSGVRSNHLSYGPLAAAQDSLSIPRQAPLARDRIADRAQMAWGRR
jgi:hypothetical protein